MAKVFRTHSTGQSQQDWFNSQNIGTSVIDNLIVQDTQGTKQPTSVPSPFARIDLVRTAFMKVASPNSHDEVLIDGVSDAHKLVSDSLDVGQVFFNYTKHSNNLSVTQWEKEKQLSALKSSQSNQHKHLGQTFELFLKQDGKQYNFDQMNSLFILKYNHAVIGGTSPRTLFFAASRANDMVIDIKFANDQMLDDKILPLYKREEAFVKYFYGLRKSNNNFATLFPEVNKYLDESLDQLRRYNFNLFNEIQTMDRTYLEPFEIMSMPNQEGVHLNVLNGYPLRLAKSNEDIIPNRSAFVILSKKVNNLPPLVLPVDRFAKDWTYTTDKWNAETSVPVYDERIISERTLPDQSDSYPYLTQNDFLSPVLMKLPYAIDDRLFLNGKSKNFMLPLTETFFKYFSAEDIGNTVKYEIEERSDYGGITTVKLSIPVKGGQHITYKKKYNPSSQISGNIEIKGKEGIIIDTEISLSIYPFISEVDTIYDIGLANSSVNKEIDLLPINTKLNDLSIETKITKRSEIENRLTKHYNFNNVFDTIEIKQKGVSNYVIPKLKKYSRGNTEYSFAIDFGTTSTHIEYLISGGGAVQPFTIDNKDVQIGYLHDKSDKSLKGQVLRKIEEIEDYLKQETIPSEIHSKSMSHFPIRTCLFENTNINYNRDTRVFSDANIGFDFEKQTIRGYLDFKTELKWSDIREVSNQGRINRYLEEILQLCKNKVLFNGGNLGKTKIIWFYPISMAGSHLNNLRGIWDNAFEKIFKNVIPKSSLIEVSESIAPFYYYKNNEGIMTQTVPAVSIDIGGGTSDVVVFERGSASLISSFKYAGNSIFGDGLNKNPNKNGFVKLYKNEFEIKLDSNNLSVEKQVLNEIFEKTNLSADFINFLFSLKKNAAVVKANAPINFENELALNDDLKLVFLTFYSALFYHIAQMMNKANINKPGSILFSGNGAKSIFTLNGSSSNWSSTESLINEIFNYVYDEDSSKANVSINIDENPKEITAKGGLNIDDRPESVKDLITTYLGGKTILMDQHPMDESTKNISFDDINKESFNDVLENVLDFFKMLESIKSKISFKNEFSVTPKANKALMKSIENKDILMDYIMVGFENQRKSAGDDSESLEETLFFYPIIGILNDLAFKISQD